MDASPPRTTRHIKLSTAFFFAGDSEPETIKLSECGVAVRFNGYVSGYYGSFSLTKGFVAIKKAADLINQNYTVIDYTVEVDEIPIENNLFSPDCFDLLNQKFMLNLKDLTPKQELEIITCLSQKQFDLANKIECLEGFNRAIINDKTIINELDLFFTQKNISLLIHTIKPKSSPALIVGSLPSNDFGLVKNAVCRFSPKTTILLS